jgi:hypothetical protein
MGHTLPPVRAPGAVLRPFRRLTPLLATLVAGGLVGFVLAGILAPILGRVPLFNGTGESAEARAYVERVLERDVDALIALRPRRDVVSRAQELQSAAQQNVELKPLSVTYMGGAGAGPTNVHIYAIGVQFPSGEQRLVPFTITVVGGKVVRVE